MCQPPTDYQVITWREVLHVSAAYRLPSDHVEGGVTCVSSCYREKKMAEAEHRRRQEEETRKQKFATKVCLSFTIFFSHRMPKFHIFVLLVKS